MIYHIDCPDRDLTQLNRIIHQLLKCGGINPILIHTLTTTSTWLCSEIFHHWIRNSDSLTSKYTELLISHDDDLRSKGYLCPYSSRATFDSRVLSRWVTYFMMMYSYISSICYTSISTLFGYEDNQPIWYKMTNTR